MWHLWEVGMMHRDEAAQDSPLPFNSREEERAYYFVHRHFPKETPFIKQTRRCLLRGFCISPRDQQISYSRQKTKPHRLSSPFQIRLIYFVCWVGKGSGNKVDFVLIQPVPIRYRKKNFRNWTKNHIEILGSFSDLCKQAKQKPGSYESHFSPMKIKIRSLTFLIYTTSLGHVFLWVFCLLLVCQLPSQTQK